MKCGGLLIPVLLYADDAVTFAEDEKSMRLGLDVVAEWCSDWLVDGNVDTVCDREELNFFRRRPRRNIVGGFAANCRRPSIFRAWVFMRPTITAAYDLRKNDFSASHFVQQTPRSPFAIIQILTAELEVVWPAIPYFMPPIVCIGGTE